MAIPKIELPDNMPATSPARRLFRLDNLVAADNALKRSMEQARTDPHMPLVEVRDQVYGLLLQATAQLAETKAYPHGPFGDDFRADEGIVQLMANVVTMIDRIPGFVPNSVIKVQYSP